MKLYYAFSSGIGNLKNFGDELNAHLWQRILAPGFLDDDPQTWLVGIGTLLNHRLPRQGRLVIAGSGCGSPNPPNLREFWKVLCVRGPLSAKALGLAPLAAITDPALLCRRVWPAEQMGETPGAAEGKASVRKLYRRSYMPHMGDAYVNGEIWREICHRFDVHYIDPFAQPLQIIREIVASEVVFAEAMHGAIVANAYGVPWSAVRTHGTVESFKWQDWALSVGCEYRPLSLYRPMFNMARFRSTRWCLTQMVALQFRAILSAGERQSQVSDVTTLQELEERLMDVFSAATVLKEAAQASMICD